MLLYTSVQQSLSSQQEADWPGHPTPHLCPLDYQFPVRLSTDSDTGAQHVFYTPFLFTLCTRDHIPLHHANIIVKFVDSSGCHLCWWWDSKQGGGNLLLNTNKNKEMVIDWGKNRADHNPTQMNGVCGKSLSVFLVCMWLMTWHGIPTQKQWSTRLSRGCIYQRF